MLKENYTWQRLWCPLDGRLGLAEDGYAWEQGALNKDLVTLESQADVPCLILLGEPGMGKSTTIDSWRANIDAQIRVQKDVTLAFDLRSYSTPEWVIRSVFENPNFIKWREGQYRLH